jgi:methanol dehydrogenase (cytochrome c) subunit 2
MRQVEGEIAKFARYAASGAFTKGMLEETTMRHWTFGIALLATAFSASIGTALAYDGTKCKAPGNCWEPKPGFPDKVEGSKYDPKHDPKELAKQQASIQGMEERNRKRVDYFKKSGKWVYEVEKIPAQ